MPKTVQTALNEQIRDEFAAAYLYLSMAAHSASLNLNGFAHWLKLQAEEEAQHAMRIYGFLEDRGARVTLKAVAQPPGSWKSPVALFEAVLKHEQAVSKSLNDIYALAVKEKDYASQAFLQWFVTEQIEEEKTASEIVETLKMIGDNRSALILLDKELRRRGEAG